ncbi:MAG: MIP/aquaporin family protein [Eubacterium sp.]|nr:MIP/aquaporin family protein [Eubacterium sp.]
MEITTLSYLSEFVGTALLVLLGDGVCASLNLEKSGFKGAGPVYCMLGWGLAVMLPAMAFGVHSGAHFNPVLTIALAVIGSFPWAAVPGYIIAQMLGGFVGAVCVWIVFRPQFEATEDSGIILGTFCTAPQVRNIPQNILCEAAATFALLFFIVTLGNNPGASDVSLNYFFIYGIIMSCGFSLGSTTGFAMNPARDISPRLAHAVLPITHKGSSDWGYAIVPVVGPLIGAILGALLGSVFVIG